jgi:hypothetical protein
VLLEVNFLFVTSHDDFIIYICDVHAKSHIIFKIVSHESSDDIKANVGFGVSHMRVIVNCWPTHVPIHYLRFIMGFEFFHFVTDRVESH